MVVLDEEARLGGVFISILGSALAEAKRESELRITVGVVSLVYDSCSFN